jgi:small GTP-binding protein
MPSRKIVVTGPASAGKTTFVSSLADGTSLSTEQRTTDASGTATTTVGLDYGQVQVQGQRATLFGTPGQTRFEYLWDILSEGADGCVFLFPADAPENVERSVRFVRRVAREENAPVVVGVTRGDLVGAQDGPDVRDWVGPLAVRVHDLDPRDRAACRRLLAGLMEVISS